MFSTSGVNGGVPVLYGDMADPEMYEHLPLAKHDGLSALCVRGR